MGGREKSKGLFNAGIVALLLSAGYLSFAQESSSHPLKHFSVPSTSALHDGSPDQQVELLKRDLKSQKKQIVAANMNLTDSEAEKFWPVYDRYAKDLATIYDTKMALIGEYLDNYQAMDGDEAESYIRRCAAVEDGIMQLRLKYIPAFRKVLSGRQAALFFQIEWRLDLAVNLQLAQAPTIEP